MNCDPTFVVPSGRVNCPTHSCALLRSKKPLSSFSLHAGLLRNIAHQRSIQLFMQCIHMDATKARTYIPHVTCDADKKRHDDSQILHS